MSTLTKQSKLTKPPFVILFAGVPGSGKSPIRNVLSYTFRLPVFENDAIRNEIREDFISETTNPDKFNKELMARVKQRLLYILENQISFIYDSSIDRKWPELAPILQKYNYTTFIISLDLSINFIEKLYQQKNYNAYLTKLKKQDHPEHQNFLKNYRH